MFLAVIYAATYSLIPAGIDEGSGIWWRSLYGYGQEAVQYKVTTCQVSWPIDGSGGYQISVYGREDSNWPEVPKPDLLRTAKFPDKIEFDRVESYDNPAGDYYDSGAGQWVKDFPWTLFVGHGTKAGRPVTIVWNSGGYWDSKSKPNVLLEVFDGDAKYLSGAVHGEKEPHSQVTERALYDWLPVSERPQWAKPGQRLKRIWTYDGNTFSAGKWKRA